MTFALLAILVLSATIVWVRLRRSALLRDDSEARFAATMAAELAAARTRPPTPASKQPLALAVLFDQHSGRGGDELARAMSTRWGVAVACQRAPGGLVLDNRRVRLRLELQAKPLPVPAARAGDAAAPLAGLGSRCSPPRALLERVRSHARIEGVTGGESALERARFAAQATLTLMEDPAALGVHNLETGAWRPRAELAALATRDALDARAVFDLLVAVDRGAEPEPVLCTRGLAQLGAEELREPVDGLEDAARERLVEAAALAIKRGPPAR